MPDSSLPTTIAESDVQNNGHDIENKLMSLRSKVVEAFEVEPKSLQLECWRKLLKGQNIFVIAPTGYGKGLIFQGFCFVTEEGIVLIIVPLKTIICDQVMQLQSLHIVNDTRGVNLQLLTFQPPFSPRNPSKKRQICISGWKTASLG